MQNNLQLMQPATDMAETYAAFVEEFRQNDELLVPWVLGLEAENFEQLVEKLHGLARGIDVPEGFVEHTTFWLIDGERELLGVSNLRHRLTPKLEREGGHIGFGVRPSQRGKGYATRLLALTLQEAGKLGIQRALLMCDNINPASARVILNNGGLFESEHGNDDGLITQKYWIEIKTARE